MTTPELWSGLGWPLVRLTFSVSLGLLAASLIESLNWTQAMARLAAPLVRAGRLSDISGASFSLAFFSGIAANTMLSEAYDKGELSRRELILSNLFNSLPTYFLHLPTTFFLAFSIIGGTAFIYVGLVLAAAFLRTAGIVLFGRLFLPPLPAGCVACRLGEARTKGWRETATKAWKRFKQRIKRILMYTIPIYTLVFFMNHAGIFAWMELFLASNVQAFDWLPPKAMSIVVFSMVGESSGALASAGAILETASLPAADVVLALLAGNILASPMRALRSQYPYYAGIFKPALALVLVLANQAVRILSLILVATAFWGAA